MSKTPSEQLKKPTEFEALARPLIEWLNDNYHPHVTAIITPTNAEVLEGNSEVLEGDVSTGQILDYVRD